MKKVHIKNTSKNDNILKKIVSDSDRYYSIVRSNLSDETIKFTVNNKLNMIAIMNQLNNEEDFLEVFRTAYENNCNLSRYDLSGLVYEWKKESCNIPFSLFYSLNIEDFKFHKDVDELKSKMRKKLLCQDD